MRIRELRWKTTPPAMTEALPKQNPDLDGRPSSGLSIRVARSCALGRSRLRALTRSQPTSDPAEESRVRGQAAFALPGAFRRDCAQRKLHPDPIGSDTCCRRARRVAGWRGRPRREQHVLSCSHDEPTGRAFLRASA